MRYRICWVRPSDGHTMYGGWLPNMQIAREWLRLLSKESPAIRCWIESEVLS
jgi:hypothetical protein